MIIWLLVLTLHNPSVMYIGGNPTAHVVVSSPQDAAVQVWDKNQSNQLHDSWTGTLYRIDLHEGIVTPEKIPEMRFDVKATE